MLTGGQLIELGMPLFSQPQAFEQVQAWWAGVVGAEEPDGFLGCDTLRQPGGLQLHTDQVAQLVCLTAGVQPRHPQRPAAGAAQSLQALQRAGLAGAVRTSNPKISPSFTSKLMPSTAAKAP